MISHLSKDVNFCDPEVHAAAASVRSDGMLMEETKLAVPACAAGGCRFKELGGLGLSGGICAEQVSAEPGIVTIINLGIAILNLLPSDLAR